MADPSLTSERIQADFERDGAFRTIAQYVERKLISTDEATQWKSRLFALFQDKIEEARREVRHLDASLARLADIARNGARNRRFQSPDPDVLRLAHELTTFDSWIISLYETDLTMVSYGAPERARAKPAEMQKAMDELYKKRSAAKNWGLKAPELFKLG
ncbi:hypothetical protein FQV39_21210 [Bosea sp. F3-2]|uniref:hypothetical protein n=1 Tax=Bosea sp. F3-2 TaxID=2599640 RepID=UPI0011EF6E99|nr:hypothetical protein [Bosea sp. F3-2]QEL24821.1 hypothetical protein FQV39_21210 [Bosea sp. F3-2]